MSRLVAHLVRFEAALRSLGMSVPANRTADIVTALQFVDIRRRDDFHQTLRTLLVQRQTDLEIFDAAFIAFWRPPASTAPSHQPRALGERRRIGPPERQTGMPSLAGGAAPGGNAEQIERVDPLSYGTGQVSRTKDFAQFTAQELEEARVMLAALRWRPGSRRTRRWRRAASGDLDIRRLIAANARYGGEPLRLPARQRRDKPRPLVVICDVSGSMERYSRMLLHFVHSLSSHADRVEAFLFSTTLTRITPQLAASGADAAVRSVLRLLPDWGSGTRIGESLRVFNLRWARRVMSGGPVVLLISDGWDRGEPEVLRREIARLRRSCHRLIWLNPLLGAPGYEPLTRGMQAALPFVHDFLPVHNLASLEALADHLNTLSAVGRPPRAQAAGVAARMPARVI